MKSFCIKEASSDDALKVLLYLKKVASETDNLSYGSEGINITIEEEKVFLNNMKLADKSVFYCVWLENELIGTGSLINFPRRMNHRAELSVSVLKQYWNHGVGSMLLQKLITYGKENGVELLHLEVRSDNIRAISLYEKFGFKKMGTFPAFFKLGEQYIDFELMYLDLR